MEMYGENSGKTYLYNIQRIFSEAKIENFIGKILKVLIFSLKTFIVGTS